MALTKSKALIVIFCCSSTWTRFAFHLRIAWIIVCFCERTISTRRDFRLKMKRKWQNDDSSLNNSSVCLSIGSCVCVCAVQSARVCCQNWKWRPFDFDVCAHLNRPSTGKLIELNEFVSSSSHLAHHRRHRFHESFQLANANASRKKNIISSTIEKRKSHKKKSTMKKQKKLKKKLKMGKHCGKYASNIALTF